MKNYNFIIFKILLVLFFNYTFVFAEISKLEIPRRTKVTIEKDQFYINGTPTYKGRVWMNYKIEGLLPNSRMVQGIFDDENPNTVANFAYPDTKKWDADRNTSEFIEAMPSWYEHGLVAFTINMQGGSPLGYGNKGWINSAFDSLGNIKQPYMDRLEKIMDRADEIGMVVILGLFYFGQDEILINEDAIRNAVKNTTEWVLERGYENVLIEIANECDNEKYDHEIFKPSRINELLLQVKEIQKNGKRLLVSTSFNGTIIPTAEVVKNSDYVLFHGNGVKNPSQIADMVNEIRKLPEYQTKPIVCNEDDHFDFDKPVNNFITATSVYASWGFFDYRMKNESYQDGFQSIPVDWSISSERKKGFFNLLKTITGGANVKH